MTVKKLKPSFLDRLKFVLGYKKGDVEYWLNKGDRVLSERVGRPTEVEPTTLGVTDVAKVPLYTAFSYSLCRDLYWNSDLLRTIIDALVRETFRNGLKITPAFMRKCMNCGAEFMTIVDECDVCGSNKLRPPDIRSRLWLEKYLEDVNFNDQTLIEVLEDISVDLNVYDNAYLAVVKEYYFDGEGKMKGAKPVEILRAKVDNVELIMDKNGRYAWTDTGKIVMFCLEHRDKFVLVDPHEAIAARCPECHKEMFPAYYRVRKGYGSARYMYYTNGEMLHVRKFTRGIGYGVSPVLALFPKLLILLKQDFFILTAYSLQRPPKGILWVRGKLESVQKAWNRLKEEAAANPHMIYPFVIEGTEGGATPMQWIDLSSRPADIDFIEFRDEIRRTVGAVYGVMPIFHGEAGGAGLSNEGLQVVVTNRAVKAEQGIFNEKILPWLMKQLAVKDWNVELVPNEMRDMIARTQRESMRLENAKAMKQLGYIPEAVITDDGIDFIYRKVETGEEVPPYGAERVGGEEVPQRFEVQPESGRPKREEQRFEGEEPAREERQVTGEGRSMVPAAVEEETAVGTEAPELVETATMSRESLGKFTSVVGDEDEEILKTNWSRAIKRYPLGDRVNGIMVAEFWKQYSGLTKEQSEKVLGVLLRDILAGEYHVEKIRDNLVREAGVDSSQAELIAKTELAELSNFVREQAYLEKTRVRKFKLKSMDDVRVCPVCREAERQTAKGVTLDELKQIVKAVGGQKARTYILHPGCRCAITRLAGKKKYWE